MRAFLVHVSTGYLHWWNLTSAVGMGAPNNPDDVQLVQFGFVCMGLPTSTTTDAEIRRLFSQVRPGSPYTATATDILTRAIGALAADRHAGTQDRQVNPFPEGSATYRDSGGGQNPYLIGYLLNGIYRAVGAADWPRLDRDPRCPPLVRQAVRTACTLPP